MWTTRVLSRDNVSFIQQGLSTSLDRLIAFWLVRSNTAVLTTLGLSPFHRNDYLVLQKRKEKNPLKYFPV
jgi:hypothetical protein